MSKKTSFSKAVTALCNISWEGGSVGWFCPSLPFFAVLYHSPVHPAMCTTPSAAFSTLHLDYILGECSTFSLKKFKKLHLWMKAIIGPVTLQQGVSTRPPVGWPQGLGTGVIPAVGRRVGPAHVAVSHRGSKASHPVSWTIWPLQLCGADSSLSHTCATTRSYSHGEAQLCEGPDFLHRPQIRLHPQLVHLTFRVSSATVHNLPTDQTFLEGSPSVTPLSDLCSLRKNIFLLRGTETSPRTSPSFSDDKSCSHHFL